MEAQAFSDQHSNQELSSLLANLRLERALLDALEALSPLDVVSFKGTLLTRRLHGSLSERVSTDNDLLVRPRDFERAVSLLLGRGYTLFGPIGSTPELLADFDQVELYPPPGREQVVIDLHRFAFSRRHFAADESCVWQNLETVELHGRVVHTFGPELTLVHLVAHAICHGLSDRTQQDVSAAIQGFGHALDFERVRVMARQTVGLTAFESVWRLLERDSVASGFPSARVARQPRAPARVEPSVPLRVRVLEELLPRLRAPGFRIPLVMFALLAPQRTLAVFGQALYPGRAELVQRFGARPSWWLFMRHAREIARKWSSSSERDP